MELKLQKSGESSGGGDGDRQPFPANSVFEAKVLACDEQQSRWRIDENDPDSPFKMNLNFKFEVIDPEGTFDRRWVWGNCAAYLSDKPQNKLRQWTQGILDLDVLPDGFALNTDDFIGKQARIIVGAKTKDDGSVSNFVTEIRPSRQAPTASNAAEFRAQNAADDEELEPF